jgi:ParB family chromosome partitioning protein
MKNCISLTESIREHGVAEPILCRPHPEGTGYQIISGHRRVEACRLAGLTKAPVTVRDMDDDLAVLLMVDSNLHREKILPSEKAFSYKMKVEALNRRGLVVSEHEGLRATEVVGAESGENYRNVMRYISLTKLMKPLLDLTDAGKLKLHPAVELSALNQREQAALIEFIANTGNRVIPSLQQAKQLKAISQSRGLSMAEIEDTLVTNRPVSQSITFRLEELEGFFPSGYSPEQIKNSILDILESRQPDRGIAR